jgi:hypothetical protein
MRPVFSGRAAAETNNHLGSGHGLHFAVAISVVDPRSKSNESETCNGTEPLGSIHRVAVWLPREDFAPLLAIGITTGRGGP